MTLSGMRSLAGAVFLEAMRLSYRFYSRRGGTGHCPIKKAAKRCTAMGWPVGPTLFPRRGGDRPLPIQEGREAVYRDGLAGGPDATQDVATALRRIRRES